MAAQSNGQSERHDTHLKIGDIVLSSMLFQEPSIRTLNHAIRALHAIPTTMLSYRQSIDIRNVYADLSYSSYLLHRPEHETLTLTFPRECTFVANLQNNYGCKMVYYRMINGALRETVIVPKMTIEVEEHTAITIYTRSKPDLVITFDMILAKLHSKL